MADNIAVNDILSGNISWAKNGRKTEFSRKNYEAGWAFLGDEPPTVEDFNYVFAKLHEAAVSLQSSINTINQDLTDYAPKASPEFTGIPTAPTAAAGTSNTQIATTAFVKTAASDARTAANNAQASANNANENANNRVAKSGDTMTGFLNLNRTDALLRFQRNGLNKSAIGFRNATNEDLLLYNYAYDTEFALRQNDLYCNKRLKLPDVLFEGGDYSGFALKNNSERYVRVEGNPHDSINMITFVYREARGVNINAVFLPKKNGTLLVSSDISNKTDGVDTNKVASEFAVGELGKVRDILIGVPIPHPLSTVPAGCLAMNGQRFDTRRYPKLAQKYPSGVLPDLRGEFIRGWDNGRGVDAGRGVLSAQGDAIRNIIGEVNTDNGWFFTTLSGAFYDSKEPYTKQQKQRTRAQVIPGYDIPDFRKGYFGFDASRVVPTANETRPRNIAFHYICLAA